MSDVSSRNGGTSGPASTFGYPYEPTNALGGEAPNRFADARGLGSRKRSRTSVRYGHVARRHAFQSPWQTRQPISRRTSATLGASGPSVSILAGNATVLLIRAVRA